MTVFNEYSRYYDLLYRDKDYEAETTFLLKTIRRHIAGSFSILDLGCGTGLHATHLASAGVPVHGVDMSEAMLDRARGRSTSLPPGAEVSFSRGDVRSVRLQETFDVVAALFHVVSYQVRNVDLLQMFRTAFEHLEPGGLFVFDYWFAPAVLTERPEVRVKRLEDEAIQVTRIAEPVLDERASTVDVNYQVLIKDKRSGSTVELNEVHSMRYLTLAEVDLLARSVGLEVMESFEWMSEDIPSVKTWGVCSVARKPVSNHVNS